MTHLRIYVHMHVRTYVYVSHTVYVRMNVPFAAWYVFYFYPLQHIPMIADFYHLLLSK